MLNPSTADHEVLDPTIRRCLHFAQDWSADLAPPHRYGTLLIGNLFAFRSRDPTKLRTVVDAVGKENDGALREIAKFADCVVVAWGDLGSLQGRSEAVEPILHAARNLVCLGLTMSREPKHPLYLPARTPPEVYIRAVNHPKTIPLATVTGV
jgi:hypothetical protein